MAKIILFAKRNFKDGNRVVSNTGGPSGDGTYASFEVRNGKNNTIPSVQLAP